MADEVKCDVLKVLKEMNTRRGKTRLQIVSWGNRSPVLEKREFWYDDADNEKTGKAKGFNAEDFQLIIEQLGEVKKLLARPEPTEPAKV